MYVFCLPANEDQSTIDPLNLNQWEFFVLSRRMLDEKLPTAKSIGLKKLRSLDPKVGSYQRLKQSWRRRESNLTGQTAVTS